MVPQLYTLDGQAGGDLVTDLTVQCLRRVDHILHTAEYAEDTGHELLCASGELAEMTGWMHFDNGRYDDARFHFGDALRTAQLAADLNLEVLVLASMNMLARYQNRPSEGSTPSSPPAKPSAAPNSATPPRQPEPCSAHSTSSSPT